MDSESTDEHDRTVVRALRSLAPLTAPTGEERRRIRDRVLLALDDDSSTRQAPQAAVGDRPDKPRPGRSTRAGDRPGDTRPATRPGPSDPRSEATGRASRRAALSGVRGRFAVAAVAVLALVGSLAGMSLLLARDALPGDALYGVKRSAEAATLGLTFSDESKALKHLEFAAARVSEIETLARRYPDPDDAPVGAYLTALTDFETDATAGSRQLIALATSTDGKLLGSLRDWSTQQAARLRDVVPHLPGAARNREIATHALLDKITARAEALTARMDCFQITSGSYDDIGALPATSACERPSPAPTTGATAPTVPVPTDSPGLPTGPETPSATLPPASPTPSLPPVPVPGATVSVPAPVTSAPPPASSTPESPPLIELPPLLPGLPGLSIG
ncbi:DUF5667 domain-containing protein [Actinophytocola sp. NPDC049390]|uniref:DUF5667 domain-containing protein n=1 Tax=Actinophytocola sp. NPDC049390 TaxID=3363894 RepID=UPI00379078BF